MHTLISIAYLLPVSSCEAVRGEFLLGRGGVDFFANGAPLAALRIASNDAVRFL